LKFKAVLWDWLGTLVSYKDYSKFFCNKIEAKYNQKIDYLNLNSQQIIYFKEELENHKELFIPASWKLVNQLHLLKIDQFIISNGESADIKKKLEYSPNNCFKEVLGSEMFDPKPSAMMINCIINKYEFKKEELIFIGDSTTDKIAAKKCWRRVFWDERPIWKR